MTQQTAASRSATRRSTVAVIFGGRSVEHDVSIVTGQQVMRAFDPARYDCVPVYIARDGRWHTGTPLKDIRSFEADDVTRLDGVRQALLSPDARHHGLIVNPLAGRFSRSEVVRIDMAFPAIHGSYGEDGTLQGLLELADIPYAGCNVRASAIASDKALTRTVMQQHDIPMLTAVNIRRDDWLSDAGRVIERIEQTIHYPVFVKPATLGSSIGVGPADDAAMLRTRIDVATSFDSRAIVEPLMRGVEINCAVMGYGDEMHISVLEQPVSFSEFLSFEEKYQRGGEAMKSAERIIPAPISRGLTERIRQITVDAFHAIGGHGIARMDYLVDPRNERVFLNEINTMPGSLAFYLWQETAVSAGDVVDRLVEVARLAHADRRRNITDYQSDLVRLVAGRGLKGSKGSKSAMGTSTRS